MVLSNILTISDTRTMETDVSGKTIAQFLSDSGNKAGERIIVKDDRRQILQGFGRLLSTEPAPDVLIITGGTGIAKRDVTIPTLQVAILDEIPGFGELFRQLSYTEIGSHAMASRAIAGFTQTDQLVFILPGSVNACRLAMEKLIIPEMNHLIHERNK